MTANFIQGDARTVLASLSAASVHCCVTSPPYFGLRSYLPDGHADKGREIGLEPTPSEFVAALVETFRAVRRVLRPDGTLWVNLGDSYSANRGYQVEQTKGGAKHGPAQAAGGRGQRADDYGLKPKNLIGIPWRVAFALQDDGWYLRSDIIWSKPNPMPESVTDRPTKAHEYVFLLSKSARYFYDLDAIREPVSANWHVGGGPQMPEMGDHRMTDGSRGHQVRRVYDTPKGANARTVWTIGTQPYDGAHFATMPPALAERCILAGSAIGDEVLDPFLGSGTTGQVAEALGRRWFGVELQPDYEPLIKARTAQVGLFGRTA